MLCQQLTHYEGVKLHAVCILHAYEYSTLAIQNILPGIHADVLSQCPQGVQLPNSLFLTGE
jgi:hypothetical protein